MSTTKPKALRVAIVQDWLYGGGAERVVFQLHQLFPDAPIYTSYCSDDWRAKLDGKVVTGWLQHLGGIRKFIPVLRIWWFTRLDLREYDLVISSSGNGEAKGVRVRSGTTHICYCHTPTHFYWRHYQEYLRRPGFGVFNPLARLGLRLLVGPLRRWDYRAAQRPDYFIANSTHIQQDIKAYYGRDSVVIHPPIDTKRFSVPEPKARHGFITADRQVPAKHIDLIIKACNQIGAQLTVIGKGPEHAHLKELAGPTVDVVDRFVSDAQIPTYFAQATAFIKASFEDFGVTPVEAQAAGTPVIAYNAGGARDYVVPGKTGELFAKQTVDSLAKVLKSFQPDTFNHAAIRAHAQQFSEEMFRAKTEDFINLVLTKKQ